MATTLGVVVVGLGRAGRARVAAVEAHPRTRLVAAVSRRRGDRLEAALDRAGVDLAICCTETADHPRVVEAALARGVDVLVEFPLAQDAATARSLVERARAAGRLLHVEHIGLLTPAHRARRRFAETGPVRVEVDFQGGSARWVAEAVAAGRGPHLAVGRLVALRDLLGPLAARCWSWEHGVGGWRMEAAFSAPGGEAALAERRAPGLPRRTRWRLVDAHGRLHADGPRPPPGLFLRDLELALAEREGAPPRVPLDWELAAIALADRLAERPRSPDPPGGDR